MLLPKYERHICLDEDPEVMRMLANQASIRAKIQDVKESLNGNFAPEPVIELGRMLHDHVRLEEDHIFPRIEKVIGETELKFGWRAAHSPARKQIIMTAHI